MEKRNALDYSFIYIDLRNTFNNRILNMDAILATAFMQSIHPNFQIIYVTDETLGVEKIENALYFGFYQFNIYGELMEKLEERVSNFRSVYYAFGNQSFLPHISYFYQTYINGFEEYINDWESIGIAEPNHEIFHILDTFTPDLRFEKYRKCTLIIESYEKAIDFMKNIFLRLIARYQKLNNYIVDVVYHLNNENISLNNAPRSILIFNYYSEDYISIASVYEVAKFIIMKKNNEYILHVLYKPSKELHYYQPKIPIWYHGDEDGAIYANPFNDEDFHIKPVDEEKDRNFTSIKGKLYSLINVAKNLLKEYEEEEKEND